MIMLPNGGVGMETHIECHCGKIELLEAGTETNVHFCQLCGKWVADAEEYFKFNEGAQALSK